MCKIVKVLISWECGVCKEKYPSARAASECEKRKLEKKYFYVGKRVRCLARRFCQTTGKGYYLVGKVTAIKGPKPSDFDYEVRCIGRGLKERLNAHVFSYIVDFTCPHCKEKQQHLYYTPELFPVSKRRNKKTEKSEE